MGVMRRWNFIPITHGIVASDKIDISEISPFRADDLETAAAGSIHSARSVDIACPVHFQETIDGHWACLALAEISVRPGTA